MSDKNISALLALSVVASPQANTAEVDHSAQITNTESTSTRASQRRMEYLLTTQPRFHEESKYLVLEQEADANCSKGAQSDWSVHRKNGFYREIANQYQEAANLALESYNIPAAVRILEKEAQVYAEKLDALSMAIHRLFSAWKLTNQTGDLEKGESIFQNLGIMMDQNIALRRIECTPNHTGLGAIGLIDALLWKAEMLEMAEISMEHELYYEEAGHLCMFLDKEGTAYGQLDPALIAGLCFEKCQKMEDQAQAAFKTTIEMINEIKKFFEMEEVFGESEEKIIGGLYKLIYGGPMCLQASLASLKCGDRAHYAEVVGCQITQFIALKDQIASEDLETSFSELLFGYMRALVSVSKTLLGSDAPELLGIKEAMLDSMQKPSPFQQHFETTLLEILTASKAMTVNEMVRRLEDRQSLLCP